MRQPHGSNVRPRRERPPMVIAALVAAAHLAAPAAAQPAPPSDAAVAVAGAFRAVEAGGAAAHELALRARLAAAPDDRPTALALATTARLTYAYGLADSLLAALAATPAGRPDPVAAYALLGRAEALHARGQLRAAERAYADAARAAAAADAREARAAAWAGAARARLRTTGSGAAAAAIDSAERALPGDAAALAADVRCARALVHATDGRADAESLAAQGLELATGAGARRVAGACRHALAAHFTRQGRMGSAMSEIARADSLLRDAGDRVAFARGRERRAWINMLLGHYGVVQMYLAEALAITRETDDVGMTAQIAADLADLAVRAGDPRAAAAKLDQAEALFASTGDAAAAGTRRLRTLLRIRSGDLDGARRLAAEELARAEAMGDWDARRAALVTLADVAVRARDWDAAERALATAERLVADGGATGWTSSLRNARGVLALRRGDAAAAAAHQEARLAALSPRQWVYLAEQFTELAHVRLLQGDTTAAERLASQASDTLDLYRASIEQNVGGPLRSTAEQQARTGFGGESGSFERVVAAVAAAGRVEAAFRLAERRRARSLADALARGSPAPAAVAPTRSQVATERRDEEVQRGLDSAYAPLRARLAEAAPPLDSVRAALPDAGTAVLFYVAGRAGAPTTAFVVTRSAPARAYRLASLDALRPAIERLDALVSDELPEDAAAALLGDSLLAPVLRELPRGVRHVVVVPDDALHRVPFALLRVGGRPLVESLAVSAAPSTRVAMALWARPRAESPPRVLALGDPEAGDVPPAADGPVRHTVTVDERDTAPAAPLPRLPAASDEAAAAARFGRGSLALLGRGASESALKRLPVDSFRVVHVAAHALASEAGATLVLAAGDGEDGFVSASDLAALRLRADLVVLSACRSADGRVVAGEGMEGLATQLIAAGARAVVAARWEVRDAATARLMTAFYEQLGRGQTAAEALRLAQRSARDAGVAPRDWAAFTVLGDGSVRFPPAARRTSWLARLLRF